MRTVTFLGITFIASASAFAAACGDSGTTTGSTSTASTTTSSTTSSTSGSPTSTSSSTTSTTGSTTSSGMGGAGGTGGTGAGGMGGMGGAGGGTVACSEATAEDHLNDANVDISFPGVGLKYTPGCIKVKAGATVTFKGDFTFHPLAGGSAPPAVDAASPIKNTTTGMSAQFPLPNAGTFDYFCQVHYALGMKGTIIVK